MVRGKWISAIAMAALMAACNTKNAPPSSEGFPPSASASSLTWPTYDRPAENGVVTDKDVPITMSDQVVLRANVARPDKDGRYPVLVQITPYNKNLSEHSPVLSYYPYLQQRGYVQLIVDVRGTGSSSGTWDSFGPREKQDYYEIIEWAAKQPWSDGNVGMIGPSYMGLNQIITASLHPPHLKAIFPIVPMADSYRDVAMAGGQFNSAFIPLWLGLITGGSLIPPQYALDGNPTDLVMAFNGLLSHAAGNANFDSTTVIGALTGGDYAYDGPFWKERSPLELDDSVSIPAFIVGGLHDLFQRGQPMHYERLRGHVTTKLLIGPWTHTGAGSGAGLPADGLPDLDRIALQWFDHYLKGMDVHADRLPPVTYYAYGENHYETQMDWPSPQLAPTRQYLHSGGVLDTLAPTTAEAPDQWLQHPVSGICTQSTDQWTAGFSAATGLESAIPCTMDDRANELLDKTFTTTPLTKDLRFQGPILANLWLSTTASDIVVSVRITDVAPDGTSTELTNGWLAASFRAVDVAKSRVVRGQLLQPWHPFTKESVLSVPANTSLELAVEVFPTNAVILKGHSLRVDVGPSDFPHAIPPVPQLASTLGGVVSLLHDPEHASYVALPTLSSDCAAGGTPGACTALLVPDMVRH